MAFIDKIKEVNLPINIYRFPNNLYPATKNTTIYNDSINLYKAILEVVNQVTITPVPVDITITQGASTVTVNSSTGLDGTIPAATTSLAGVLSSADKLILDNLYTLAGVPGSNLGTFTGVTLPDNLNIKQALQALETAIETTLVGATNLSTSYDLNFVIVSSSTGLDTVIDAVSPLNAGVMSSSQYALLQTVPQIQTLTGLTAGNTNLGTFTGTTITDNVTIKVALQELETAVEAASGGGGIYGGSGTIGPDAVATTSGAGFSIDNLGDDNVRIGDIGNLQGGFAVEVQPYWVKIGNSADLFDKQVSVNGAGVQINAFDVGININDTFPTTKSMTLTAYSAGSGIYIHGNDAAFPGAQYTYDYSANYTNRSLVDKEYVDGLTGTTTDLATNYAVDAVGILSSSGADTFVYGATDSLAGVMTAADKRKLDDLVTLTGVAAEATDLGTFTGTTIPDTSDIKEALQALETAVESVSITGGAWQTLTTNFIINSTYNTLYAKPQTNNITLTCGGDMSEGEIYYVYARPDNGYALNFAVAATYLFFVTTLVPGTEFTSTTQTFSGDDRNYAFMLQRRSNVIFLTRITHL